MFRKLGFMGNTQVKKVFVLNINNYMPELCAITMPTINRYAEKIGVKLEIVSDRKYPEWPVTYEKMQLYDLAKELEWAILIDADTVILKDMPDVTNISNNIIGIHMAYDSDKILPSNYDFIQDRRNVGVATNFMVVPHACHEIWTPSDEGVENVLRRLRCHGTQPHIIDEYCISTNLARYKYDFIGITQYCGDKFVHLDAHTNDLANIIKSAEALVNV